MDKAAFEREAVLWRGRLFTNLLTSVVAYGETVTSRVMVLGGLPHSRRGYTYYGLQAPNDPQDETPAQHYVGCQESPVGQGACYDFTRPGKIATLLSVVTSGDYPDHALAVNGESAIVLTVENEEARQEWVQRQLLAPAKHPLDGRIVVKARAPNGQLVL